MAMYVGLMPPTSKACGGWKVPSPLPSMTAAVLEPALATARSSLPSRFRSPTATTCGLGPASKLTGGPKVPSPFPSNTDTVVEK